MLWLTIQHFEYKDVKPERIALKKEYYFWTLVKGTADKKQIKSKFTQYWQDFPGKSIKFNLSKHHT